MVRGAELAGLGVTKITKSPFYREKNSKFVTIPDPNSELWPNRSILAAHYLMMANSENWTKRRLVDRLAEDCGVEVSNSLIRAVRVRLNHATRKKPKIETPRPGDFLERALQNPKPGYNNGRTKINNPTTKDKNKC